jgi:heme/copper-type cytochrome/quinol oxidase subunit 3
MSELAPPVTGYEVVEGEPPEILARNLTAAGQLLASATAFFFLAFVFAYFYLRSVNNAGLWKPKGVDASVTWGTVVTLLLVASAVLVRLGEMDRRATWRRKGVAALVCGVVGLVLQVVAWTQQGFGPADGGFASVYFGWTAFQFLFVLGTLVWLEMTLATSFRYREQPQAPPGHASGDSGRMGHDIRNPVALNTAELSALSFYWTFLAGVVALSWVVLYLV